MKFIIMFQMEQLLQLSVLNNFSNWFVLFGLQHSVRKYELTEALEMG